MKINRNGFVYEIAYIVSKEPKDGEKTNICSFFWKFLGGCLVSALIFTVLTVYVICASVILFFVGWRVNLKTMLSHDNWNATAKENKENNVYLHVKCKKWPTMCGYRILPIYFIGAYIAYIGAHIPYFVYDFYWTILLAFVSDTPLGQHQVGGVVGLVLVLFVLAMCTAILYEEKLFEKLFPFIYVKWEKLSKNEVWMLCKEYVRAKKKKFCPIVEFIDGNTETGE